MRRFSLALLALPLIASTAVGQERSRGAPPAERPAAAAPRPSPPSGQRTPAASASPRTPGGTAATSAGETRRTGAGATGARPQAAAPPAGGARPNRPGGAQAALVESFDDWSAYATPAGRGRICYALSQPTARTPKTLSRDDAYLFVSIRPAENVRNEVAVMLGFPVLEPGGAETADASGRGAPAKPAPEQQLVVGSARFAIAGKDQNAWLADAAQEGSLVAVMTRGQKLAVRAVSKRGTASTDEYSLKGFGDALRKAREECR
jgi:hypothetical protein